MIRAHLRRSIGGGLAGPLRSLPQESVARAKPALEAERSTHCCAISDPLVTPGPGSVPLSSAGCAGATSDCSPRTHGAQPVAVLRLALRPGGRFRKGGEAPLRVERTGSTPRVRPSGAASQLDPFERPAGSSASHWNNLLTDSVSETPRKKLPRIGEPLSFGLTQQQSGH